MHQISQYIRQISQYNYSPDSEFMHQISEGMNQVCIEIDIFINNKVRFYVH